MHSTLYTPLSSLLSIYCFVFCIIFLAFVPNFSPTFPNLLNPSFLIWLLFLLYFVLYLLFRIIFLCVLSSFFSSSLFLFCLFFFLFPLLRTHLFLTNFSSPIRLLSSFSTASFFILVNITEEVIKEWKDMVMRNEDLLFSLDVEKCSLIQKDMEWRRNSRA